jgi:hypothetical protein
VTDGCFYGDGGMFRISPPFELKKLEALFLHKVLRMLLNKGKITQEMIAMLSTWRHSGFNVFCGNRIWPKDETAKIQRCFRPWSGWLLCVCKSWTNNAVCYRFRNTVRH